MMHILCIYCAVETEFCKAVGIATSYGLDGPGLDPGGSEILHTRPDRPWDPPSLLYNGYQVFARGG
jgi:hypothetical protein